MVSDTSKKKAAAAVKSGGKATAAASSVAIKRALQASVMAFFIASQP